MKKKYVTVLHQLCYVSLCFSKLQFVELSGLLYFLSFQGLIGWNSSSKTWTKKTYSKTNIKGSNLHTFTPICNLETVHLIWLVFWKLTQIKSLWRRSFARKKNDGTFNIDHYICANFGIWRHSALCENTVTEITGFKNPQRRRFISKVSSPKSRSRKRDKVLLSTFPFSKKKHNYVGLKAEWRRCLASSQGGKNRGKFLNIWKRQKILCEIMLLI